MNDKFFSGMFVVAILANLAFWGFVAWAIYRLVLHFTGG